jgi:hypothetical protein
MNKSVAAGLFAAVVSAFPVAASAGGHGLYAGVGTLGINLGYKYGISEKLGIRVGANTFKYGDKFKDDGIEYKGDLKLNSLEVLADWHPFRNGFALSGGVLLNDNKFDGTARPDASGTLRINGVDYSGANPRANVEGRLGKGVTPYVGLGLTLNPAAVKGLRFNAGAGVVFQQPDAKLTVSGVTPTGTLEADRVAAEKTLEKDMKSLRNYPVLTVGTSYAF